MDRNNLSNIVSFLRRVAEDFTEKADAIDGHLSSNSDQVVMEAEDDLDHLQTTLTETINEAQNVLFLISEILP